MGMGSNSNKGSGRVTMSEINVTPMVDVMLVLLIIFMVTAPLIQQGVKVNLPEARAAAVEASDKKLVLSIDAQRRVYLGEAEVLMAELEKKLATNAKAQADKELYLHADRDVPYGVVVDVMAAAQRAGITNVGMITDPSAGGRASASSKGKKEARR
ncbi:protein TolR [Cystobacter fuscus]|uniref:Biopolymer transport protein ExbD/TolR n=2 Tax=Cystobacter fuscus TaxID=43 RepID=S9PFL0_CYSF2|nr:protein TolR [Cystobacter fuscus]ATB42534.1 biopolymer transporter ExbD [Cystobacter fuscus]EPX63165.1 Biopolymer transport protein ExbD/TolR [Cystobacter fuscus DSM 2262]WNG20081.1 protein TolR [Cystobacter fuscus]WNG29626.1 protein TolR [Cystobacter fuscus]